MVLVTELVQVKCIQVLRKLWSNALSLTVRKILLPGEGAYKGQVLNWFSMTASIVIQ